MEGQWGRIPWFATSPKPTCPTYDIRAEAVANQRLFKQLRRQAERWRQGLVESPKRNPGSTR